jgi:sugar lactone lactonase YvrE
MDRIHWVGNILFGVTLALVPRPAATQVVTTFAGSGAAGSADGPALAASFIRPQGVAVDAFGNVIVADTGSRRIRRVGANGLVTTIAGTGKAGYNSADVPALAASFFGPQDVAVDASGVVWIFDQDDGIDGQWLLKITTDGVLHQAYVGTGPIATLSSDLYLLLNGNALNGGVLLRVPASGAGHTLATGIPPGVAALAVDAFANVYLADTLENTILEVTAAGAVITLAGTGSPGSADGPASTASFNGPTGIAVNGTGNIYVADTGNNRIRRIGPGGLVTTIAGTGAAGDADGPPGTATFNAPSGLALDAAGNLYVADTGNNTVRRIALGAACGVGCANWTVPTLAHIGGADGSFWTSDLILHNRGSAPAPVTLKFLGNARDGTSGPESSFTLDPFQTVTYADVLSSVFGIADDAGALEVLTPSDQLTVRSRTFTTAAGGTIGDGIPGVRQGSFFTDQTSPGPVLIGLREDDQFRSNLILVNATAAPLVVHVAATDESGAPIGSRDYPLPPLGMIQDSRFLTRDEFGGGRVTGVTVTLSSTTPGAAFTACAIVIDNASNAPTTVPPQ